MVCRPMPIRAAFVRIKGRNLSCHNQTGVHWISFSSSARQVSDKIDDEFPLFEDHPVVQIDRGLADDAIQVDLGLDRAAGQRSTASGADVGPAVHPLAFETWVLADEGCSGISPDPPGGELVGV